MLRTSIVVTICVGLGEIVLFSFTIVIAIVAAIVACRQLFENFQVFQPTWNGSTIVVKLC